MAGINLKMVTKKNSPDKMSFTSHLNELRNVLLFCLGYLVLGTLLGFYFAKDLVSILKLPAKGIIDTFILTKPAEVISIYFKVSLYAGAVITSPALFFHLWRFIKPTVSDDIKVSVPLWFISVAIMFTAGTVFSFFLLVPPGISFLINISKEIAEPMININSYISFALAVIILGGIIFEMPVLSALLTKLRIISPEVMKHRRKETIFALCVIAALITPTTDVFNMALFVFPMIVLYEVSILVSSIVFRFYVIKPGEEAYINELT